jgi:hypothetical protein
MIGKTTIIGFGYKARRGKDTAVSAIVKAFPAYVRRYAFGDALKEEVEWAAWMRADDGMPRMAGIRQGLQRLCKWAGVPYDSTADKQRPLLQWWGTEYRRAQDPHYWTKRLTEKIFREQPQFALISDLRFFNERGICDFTVRMDRPGFEIDDGSHHISERQLDVLPDSAWTCIVRAQDPEEVELYSMGAFRQISGLSRLSL